MALVGLGMSLYIILVASLSVWLKAHVTGNNTDAVHDDSCRQWSNIQTWWHSLVSWMPSSATCSHWCKRKHDDDDDVNVMGNTSRISHQISGFLQFAGSLLQFYNSSLSSFWRSLQSFALSSITLCAHLSIRLLPPIERYCRQISTFIWHSWY